MPRCIPPSAVVPWNAMISPELVHAVPRATLLPRNGPDEAHLLVIGNGERTQSRSISNVTLMAVPAMSSGGN